MGLRHWAHGPFELLCHAEGHLRAGEDFDRRIALISFDNSIEVSITTFLTLNPMLRGGRSYPRASVETWLSNYHSKLTFLDEELKVRSLSWKVPKEDIVWAHDHRNEQYHGGGNGTPEKRVLSVIRDAAFWVFGVLFDVPDVDQEVVVALAAQQPKALPSRDGEIDRRLDDKHGLVEVAGKLYYTSEALFALDPVAYRDASSAEGDDE
jgi:hypothetical protein